MTMTSEAQVVCAVMERMLTILENGEAVAGFNWNLIGIKAGRRDKLFARFRNVRDDMAALRLARAILRPSTEERP